MPDRSRSNALKTPVIGSGLGTMKEFLEEGQQIICRDFNSLQKKVEYLLNHPEVRKKWVKTAIILIKKFTVEKFKDDRPNLIRKLI